MNIKTPAPIWPHPVEEGYTITYKFTSGDIDYFAITDAFNISSHRGLSGMQVYDEWESRMTNATLKTFIQAMKEELDAPDGTVKLSKIAQYILFMEERLTWPIPTSELFYKMASVLVFDQSESPWYYDAKYCDVHKIPHWKAKGVDTFFLSQQLKTFLPLPNIAPDVLTQLQKIVDKAAKINSPYSTPHSPTESETPSSKQEALECES